MSSRVTNLSSSSSEQGLLPCCWYLSCASRISIGVDRTELRFMTC